jgi:hypothetical protein
MPVLKWNSPHADDNTITFLPQNWFTDMEDLSSGLPYTEPRSGEPTKIVNGGGFLSGDITRYRPLEHLRSWVPWLEGKIAPIVVWDWEYPTEWEHCEEWIHKTLEAITEFGGGDGRTNLVYDLASGGHTRKLLDGAAVSMNGSPGLLRERRQLLRDRDAWPLVIPVFHPRIYDDEEMQRGMEICKAAWPHNETAISWTWPDNNPTSLALAKQRAAAVERLWESIW